MCKHCVLLLIISCAIVIAVEPAKVIPEKLPVLVGDEYALGKVVPYLGGRQSPGDSIGMTWYDMQSNCNPGHRIVVDDYEQAHIDWMRSPDPAFSERFCAWNARFADGSYFGETPAAPSWSGYVQIDFTRDTDPDNQRTVIAYHYFDTLSGAYYAWIDIDEGNLHGVWPNDPKSPYAFERIWPHIAVANNNSILMATGDHSGERADTHHIYLTTNLGDTWTHLYGFDSCPCLTPFVRASRNPSSNKVVFAHTQLITDSVAGGQVDQDVWSMVSTDGGLTWGPHTNLTNYQPYPIDSVRAYADVNAAFDYNDNLHMVWAGRRVDTAGYWSASKIFHWDEINDTITIVSSPSIYYSDSGGWWISTRTSKTPGAWRMPADWPHLVFDPNGTIYCLWHGNDDYNDGSAAGYFNGEFYASYSTDNGITWADYVNLTNTRSPDAGPGFCMDEDYMTAYPYTVNDSIFITYIEDKDAGGYPNVEGIATENPVRCWVFHKNLITGIKEDDLTPSKNFDLGPTIFKGALILPKDKKCRVFDITGRKIDPKYVTRGIYFIEIDHKIVQKVVKVR